MRTVKFGLFVIGRPVESDARVIPRFSAMNSVCGDPGDPSGGATAFLGL
jgi:hypothetical protein